MKNILLLIDSELVDFWICNVIEKLLDESYINIEYQIINSKKKKHILFNILLKYTKNRNINNIDAFSKKHIKYYNISQSKKPVNEIRNSIIINFSGKNVSEFIGNSNKLIEFRYGRANLITWEKFGLIEIQNNIYNISSALYLYDYCNIYLIHRTYSSINILSFYEKLNEHFIKQSAILIREIKKYFLNDVNLIKIGQIFETQIKISVKKLLYIFIREIILAIYKRFIIKNKKWVLRYSFNINDDYKKFNILSPPKNYFWADPFICKSAKFRYHLFIEEKMIGSNKGHISVIELNEKSQKKAIKIIEENYHLSYPFIFKYGGNYYIIPESSANQTINLYKCIEYPYKWKFVKYLMTNIRAFDTTLFEYNNKWWLFTNVQSIEGMSIQDELFLFYSDSPISSEWIPHKMNPIISDVRRSRPAGRIFLKNGKIIRPSQNSSKRYGWKIILNEIKVLNENEYFEIAIGEIAPWNHSILALHTFNMVDNLRVIDTFE